MRMEFVRVGDGWNTPDGFIRITARHGEDFWADEFEVNEDGNYNKIGESLLTRHDLNRIAKEADGQNHNIWWEEPALWQIGGEQR